jgi:hypothetical protein
MRPAQPPKRSREEITADINRLLSEHPELINPPQGGEIPAKRKRGRPATGYVAAKWAAEAHVSVRMMERAMRIGRHWPELIAEVRSGRMNMRDAERLVILRQRDPALLDLVMAGQMSIQDAGAAMRRRNVILLSDGEGAH